MGKRFGKVDAKSVLADNLSIDSVGVSPYLGYNHIINGDLSVNQKSLSSTAGLHGTYQTDRFISDVGTLTTTVSREVISQPTQYPGGASLKVVNTGSSQTTTMGFYQRIEDYSKFKGREVTASVLVKSNEASNCRLLLWDGVAGYSSVVHDGEDGVNVGYGVGWQLLTVTATVSSSATGLLLYIGMTNSSFGNVTVGSKYVEFTAAKLEIGSVATPFVPRLIGEELALCQRYYFRIGFGAAMCVATCQTSSYVYAILPFPVVMRAAPVGSSNWVGGEDFRVLYLGTAANLNSAPVLDTDKHLARIYLTATVTAGASGYLYTSNPAKYMEFNAEL